MPDLRNIQDEFIYKANRSKGPGGQNVNKVNTRVEVRFNIPASAILTEADKQQLMQFYRSRISIAGDLQVVSQESRSQLYNKEDATRRMLDLLQKAFIPRRKRISTKPTRVSVLRRLEQKKRISEKKSRRSKQNLDRDR